MSIVEVPQQSFNLFKNIEPCRSLWSDERAWFSDTSGQVAGDDQLLGASAVCIVPFVLCPAFAISAIIHEKKSLAQPAVGGDFDCVASLPRNGRYAVVHC
jgi:hypothetical protein